MLLKQLLATSKAAAQAAGLPTGDAGVPGGMLPGAAGEMRPHSRSVSETTEVCDSYWQLLRQHNCSKVNFLNLTNIEISKNYKI